MYEDGTPDDSAWQEALRDNLQTAVPDQVAFRMDFPAWLGSYAERDRRLIEDMAVGERSTQLARKYGVSAGRIAQKRTQYRKDWQRYCGESAAVAAS